MWRHIRIPIIAIDRELSFSWFLGHSNPEIILKPLDPPPLKTRVCIYKVCLKFNCNAIFTVQFFHNHLNVRFRQRFFSTIQN